MDYQKDTKEDWSTAQSFANSWNNLPAGSVYTREQVEDWLRPLTPEDIKAATVLEMGCGNGSLLVHVAGMEPAVLKGIDLGDSVLAARRNMAGTPVPWSVDQEDLVSYTAPEGFEVVYCIGVLHHLKQPEQGLEAVLRNTAPQGRFHCWVYAREGNALVRALVDPLRRIASRCPWWLTKYFIATPLAAPYFLYAKALARLPETVDSILPLAKYSRWISRREFAFFRHVAFDQLVTPQTAYISKEQIEKWLESRTDVQDTYIIMRNGNSWKFGGRKL